MNNSIAMISARWLIGLIVTLTALSASAKLFVPDLEPWDIWEPSDELSPITVDHSEWQSLLSTYLMTDTADGIYLFRYRTVSNLDRARLQAYLASLGRVDPHILSRAEQKAYWINLYNALTVETVLLNYPVKSIRKIDGGLFATGPWNEPLVEINGIQLTLNDIEHRILRPLWRDPRIHYAVNCASLGCPNLAAEAYTAENTERLLELSAAAYINHPRGVSIENDRLTASSIYNWYDVDFGGDQQGLVAHWLRYAEPGLAQQLERYDGKFRYDYDWDLNEP